MDLIGTIIRHRYKIDRHIGEDAISSHYIAHDLTPHKRQILFQFLKNNVISKRIEDIIRFRMEVNTVSELEHPNIIKIVDAGELIEIMYVAAEYFPGTSLLDLLKTGRPDLDWCVDIIMQVCRGLDYLHENNVIHRYLKPANILIDDKNVKLAGFGLSHLLEFNETVKFEEIKNYFNFISPEQCGILKRNIDERSDLYSVGVIFFQLLTGSVPFQGTDICSIIHQHIARVPESPSLLNPGVPGILDRIVLKLLDKEPANRYQSARGLLSDLERYRAGQREFIPGLDDRFTKLTYRTKLISREREMGMLNETADHMRKGSGCVNFITGKAGSGKTRLIEEFKSVIFANGWISIEGKCSIQTNKVPNEPVKEALDSFLMNYHNFSQTLKDTISSSLREEFGNLGEIIIKLNPAMKELLGECPPLVALEPGRENKRFHMIIGKFLLKLSDLTGGMVLILENLQWTDEGTINLLHELLNEINPHRFAVIGSFRDDEVPEGHALERLKQNIAGGGTPYSEIRLGQFDASTMKTFVSGLLGEAQKNIRDISEFIFQKSGGNPFFAIEILKQLIEESVLTIKNVKWVFDETRLGSIKISASIVDVIFNRINKLDKNEKDILSTAAVIGEKFNMQLLFRLSGLDRTEIVRIIDKAIELQLLIDLPTWGDIGFAHDRIKEAFYHNLVSKKRKNLHIAIANAIEENNREDLRHVIFDLAHHFIEGGDTERAIIFAYPAGIQAMGNYANEEALKYFKLALTLLENQGLGECHQWVKIVTHMSKVHLTIGNNDEAIEFLQRLIPLVEAPIEKADIYSCICAAYLRKGDWRQCEDYAIRCGELLGEYFTDNKLLLVILIMKEIMLSLVRFLFFNRFTRSREGKTVEYNKLKAKFALPVLWFYIMTDTLKFSRLTLRALNVAVSKIGKSAELGMAIGGFGGILMALTFFNLSQQFHEKALAMREEVNDFWGAAQSHQWLGYCYQWQGNFKKSVMYFTESAKRFENIGDIYEMGNSCGGLIYNYYYLSDYVKMKQYLDQYCDLTNKTNDFYGINEAWILSTPYFLETGDIDAAEWLGLASYNYSLDSHILFSNCRSCIELGKVYLEKRDNAHALEYLEKAYSLHKNNNFLEHYTIHVYPYLAEAYLCNYVAGHQGDLSKNKLLHKTREFCKKSLKKTKVWPGYYGSALLVNAKMNSVIGRKKLAGKFFLRSIAHNKRIGRRFSLAKCYYEYGLFLSQTEYGAKARKNLETAYRIFISIGAKKYEEELRNLLGIKKENGELSSIERRVDNERLTSVIRLAKEVSHISDMEQLLDRILFKAVEITGAQRGCIFIANDSNDLDKKAACSTIDVDSPMDRYAMNIITSVYRTQKQIIIGGDAINAGPDSSAPSSPQAQSILCVPIKERDRTIGVCYLDNSLTSGIFTDKEANLLLTFLSHVAFAMGIENIERAFKSSKSPEKKSTHSPIMNEKIQKALDYIQENYAYEISREGLASHIGLHHDNLGRYFKQYFGKKMNDYINELRIKEAARKLQETDEKIIDIAFSVGFGSLRTFNKSFREIMKISPASYRKRSD